MHYFCRITASCRLRFSRNCKLISIVAWTRLTRHAWTTSLWIRLLMLSRTSTTTSITITIWLSAKESLSVLYTTALSSLPLSILLRRSPKSPSQFWSLLFRTKQDLLSTVECPLRYLRASYKASLTVLSVPLAPSNSCLRGSTPLPLVLESRLPMPEPNSSR